MTASFERKIAESDIALFAEVSGDNNPVHLDRDFAEKTMFGDRIAHGMLTASFFSTAIGTRLPGPGAIYLKQSLNFKAPVRPGDMVEIRVTIREIFPGKRRVLLDTVACVGGKVVLDGEALIMMPGERP